MKKSVLATLVALTITALTFVSCKNKSTDFCQTLTQGAQAAQKSGKDILLIYTMDGDDGSSTEFIENVLKASAFKNDVCSKYEIVHIDFGQKTYEKTIVRESDTKKQQAEAEAFANLMQENMKDANLISVKSTPSVYVFTKEKYYITQLDYSDDINTVALFNELISVEQPAIDEIHGYAQTIKDGTTEEKLEAINSLYDATEATYRAYLYDLVLDYMKLDKTNSTGRLGKFTLGKADLEALNLFSAGDPMAAAQKYADVAQDPALDPEQKQNAYYMAAYLLSVGGSPDPKPILRYLKAALDAAPDSDAVPHIMGIYDTFVEICKE